MTLRSILIGILFAAVVAVGGHFNDVYMWGQTYMVGNLFPISVIGMLVVLVLVINPVLRRLKRSWVLSPAELAVMVALPFAVCVVPGSGFLRTFTPALAFPAHYERLTPSWEHNNVLSYAPPQLLPGAGENTQRVTGNFLRGMRTEAREHIAFRDVPWDDWIVPLTRWIPLFLCIMLGLIGLSLILHRQWSQNEHLSYPIAEFVGELTGALPGSGGRSITGSRPFWYGFTAVFLLHLVNGINAWFPGFIQIPHHVDLTPLRELFPRFAAAPESWYVFYGTIFFSVAAFAYFLPSDVTLSLGLAPLAASLTAMGIMAFGLTVHNSRTMPEEALGFRFGGYLGMAIFILYAGRSYYARVLLTSLGLRRRSEEIAGHSVWGCRAFLASAVGACWLMTLMGLPWPVAVAAFILFVILFMGMSRICVETGFFFVTPEWMPIAVITGFVGAQSLGPGTIAALCLISVVLAVDPREAMMPFFANSLRMAENVGLPRGRLALLMASLLVIGLIAGLCMVLWLQYDRGVGLDDWWATQWVPRFTFDCVDTHIQQMKADGVLEQAVAMTAGERVAAVTPKKSFLVYTLVGMGLFGACMLLRLRFSRWPFHPVLFLVWFTWNAGVFSWSFLIGWIVKGLVAKFGGADTYQKGKPLMMGIIAGEMAVGLLFMAIGAVYYQRTGYGPKPFFIFPL